MILQLSMKNTIFRGGFRQKLAIAALLVLFSTFALVGSVSASSPTMPPSTTRWVWLVGYSGDNFKPSVQLGLSPSAVINVVSQMSAAVGKSNLALVSVIGVAHGSLIQTSFIPTLQSYVATLHQYAAYTIGRIGLGDFNQTTNPSISTVLSQFATIGVDGVWIDQVGGYYKNFGQTAFNNLMQTLANQEPNFIWLVNMGGGTVALPLPGYAWANHAYALPSPVKGSYDKISLAKIATMNLNYPGRVILHFDSDAWNSGAPMGVFANQTSEYQTHIVQNLTKLGLSSSFSMLFPVLGANTCHCSMYNGSLYNSLSTGTYARSTYSDYIATMQTSW